MMHVSPARRVSLHDPRATTTHAANERTFLARVCTAIAAMSFGFLIGTVRFVLEINCAEVAQTQPRRQSEAFANWAGLGFIVLASS
jgi:uncharacterized membrane protein YidH (DUF202 family)